MEFLEKFGLNWLVLVILGCFILSAVLGYAKGFARIVLSLIGGLAALVLACVFAGRAVNVVRENTNVEEKIQVRVEAMLEKQAGGDAEKLDAFIEGLPLPASVKESIKAQSGGLYEKMISQAASALSGLILRAAVCLILFILITILILLAGKLMDLITKLPVIHEINGLMGMIIAILVFLLILNIFFLVLTVFAQYAWGVKLLGLIRECPVTNWMYQHNFLMGFGIPGTVN